MRAFAVFLALGLTMVASGAPSAVAASRSAQFRVGLVIAPSAAPRAPRLAPAPTPRPRAKTASTMVVSY